MFGLTEKCSFPQPVNRVINPCDYNVTIGRSSEALEADIIVVEDHIKKLLGHRVLPKPTHDDIISSLTRWRTEVYLPICRKTVEITNFLGYNFELNELSVTHEITGWNDMVLLLNFCAENNLKLDSYFVNTCHKKMFNLASLTLQLTFQILIEEDGSKADYCVFLQVCKPFNNQLMQQLLADNCEKSNINMWYDSNLPMGNDFGYSFNTKQDTREMLVGFYIMDGPARANLKKALSAYQSYGAEFSDQQVEILKKIPCEELRVHFYVNENGVAKVRMLLYNIKDKILGELVHSFPQKDLTPDKLTQFITLVQSEDSLIEKTNNQVAYFLDFSVDGFKLGSQVLIGEQSGSFVHFEGP